MILSINIAGTLRKVELEKIDEAGGYRVVLDGEVISVVARLLRPGVLSLIIEGKSHRCVLDENPADPAIHVGSDRIAYRHEDPRSLTSRKAKLQSSLGPRSIKAPMPGRVVRILVQEGDDVSDQQGLIVIEAMKMQNELKAPRAGRVLAVLAEVDSAVVSGQPLLLIE